MSRTKNTKTPTTKASKRATKAEAPEQKTPREELVVFAFRLSAGERDAIHKAAGPARASRFARTLLVAAARNDASAVKAIMEGGKATE